MATRHPEQYRFLLRQMRQARLDAGLSQEEVARRLGVAQTFISRIERGERRIDPVELKELADLYEKDLLYFFDER